MKYLISVEGLVGPESKTKLDQANAALVAARKMITSDNVCQGADRVKMASMPF